MDWNGLWKYTKQKLVVRIDLVAVGSEMFRNNTQNNTADFNFGSRLLFLLRSYFHWLMIPTMALGPIYSYSVGSQRFKYVEEIFAARDGIRENGNVQQWYKSRSNRFSESAASQLTPDMTNGLIYMLTICKRRFMYLGIFKNKIVSFTCL